MQADYVIVGAGSAGCVLANRLTEDAGTRVVLIEAGGRDWNPLIHIPAGYMKLLDHPTLTWGFKAEADPGTNGRAINYPRGRVLGGSSSINGMIYVRGQPEDFDHWAPARQSRLVVGRRAAVLPQGGELGGQGRRGTRQGRSAVHLAWPRPAAAVPGGGRGRQAARPASTARTSMTCRRKPATASAGCSRHAADGDARVPRAAICVPQ